MGQFINIDAALLGCNYESVRQVQRFIMPGWSMVDQGCVPVLGPTLDFPVKEIGPVGFAAVPECLTAQLVDRNPEVYGPMDNAASAAFCNVDEKARTDIGERRMRRIEILDHSHPEQSASLNIGRLDNKRY